MIRRDREGAWASAYAMQAKEPLQSGDFVAHPSDIHRYRLFEITGGMATCLRAGENGEDPFVEKRFPTEELVSYTRINIATLLHTDGDVIIADSIEEAIQVLGEYLK